MHTIRNVGIFIMKKLGHEIIYMHEYFAYVYACVQIPWRPEEDVDLLELKSHELSCGCREPNF